MGNAQRARCGDDWLEFCTMAAQNGPSVAELDLDRTLQTWQAFGHHQVGVSDQTPTPRRRQRQSSAHGLIKTKTRSKKKLAKRNEDRRVAREHAVALQARQPEEVKKEVAELGKKSPSQKKRIA